MTPNGIFQILLYTAVIIALAKPMGAFMAKVFAGERTWLHRILRPVETAVYKLCGIDETAEQHWTRYAGSLLVFSVVSLLFTYLIQRVQQWLPAQSRRAWATWPPTSASTPPSASPPTPTGRRTRPKPP